MSETLLPPIGEYRVMSVVEYDVYDVMDSDTIRQITVPPPAPIYDYLTTLRRVPDDIILAVASRDLILTSDSFCLCAWLAREGIARRGNTEPDEVEWAREHSGAAHLCVELYGGSFPEWHAIYWNVCYADRCDAIETAFAQRMDECVGPVELEVMPLDDLAIDHILHPEGELVPA